MRGKKSIEIFDESKADFVHKSAQKPLQKMVGDFHLRSLNQVGDHHNTGGNDMVLDS